MVNKKHVAAIVAVQQHFNQTSKTDKIAWTDNRSGWHNHLRGNWTK